MPTVLFRRSMRVKPLKSKSFGFGNLFATFSRFLSSQWVPVVYGRTRRFAYFRVCRPKATPLVCAPRLLARPLGIAQESI